MKTSSTLTTWGLAAVLSAAALVPALADSSSQQKNKNNWRNLGIAGAAVAGYGLLNHNSTATILGAAGAAYSANRYENDRKNQSQDNNNRRYYRTYGWHPPVYNNGNNNGGYNNSNNSGGYYDNNGNYHGGYNNGGYTNNGYNGNNNGGYNNSNNENDDNYQNSYARRDNGKHKGWYKHQGQNKHGGGRD